MKPTVSVALCTYNGERFLSEQLNSIIAQSLPPDEVVIADDGSKDSTPSMLEKFQSEAPFTVVVHRNSKHLGITYNFEQAIRLCRGDIIALSDQDDVWAPNKLARSTEILDNQKTIAALFSDALLVKEDGKQIGLPLSRAQNYNTGRTRRQLKSENALEVLVRRNVCTGATMVFRAELRNLILPFPIPMPCEMLHDAWIGLVAALHGSLGFLDEPLLLYRQHGHQALGANLQGEAGIAERARWSFERRQNYLRENTARAELLRSILLFRFPDAARLGIINDYTDFLRMRSSLPTARSARVRPIVKNVVRGTYRRYAKNGLVTAVRDLL